MAMHSAFLDVTYHPNSEAVAFQTPHMGSLYPHRAAVRRISDIKTHLVTRGSTSLLVPASNLPSGVPWQWIASLNMVLQVHMATPLEEWEIRPDMLVSLSCHCSDGKGLLAPLELSDI